MYSSIYTNSTPIAVADSIHQHCAQLSSPSRWPIRLKSLFTRALLELSRIIGDAESNVEITVTPSGGQVLFHTESTDLVSRLIEGR